MHEIEQWAASLKKQYPRSAFTKELAVTDVYVMAKEGFDLAKKWAYTDIKNNTAPSDDYLKTRFPVCARQITLAGYRLADMLNNHIK